MRRPARLVTVILALGGPFACGGESGSRGDGPGVEVRDSAGVEIVLNHGAGSSPIAITESLRIGALEGPEEEQLFRVRPPVVGEDGSIYVPLLGTGEIRVFSGDGTHLHTTGRPGDGPGEFRGLSRAYLSGDDLVALDMAAYRVTVFDPASLRGTSTATPWWESTGTSSEWSMWSGTG